MLKGASHGLNAPLFVLPPESLLPEFSGFTKSLGFCYAAVVAVESGDCTDPTAKCFVELGGQMVTAQSNPNFGRITVLNKSKQSPIPTALVIVDTPNE